ncbi:hypothetical protein ACHQM5_002246 [Ranunculus cassubicifolius]
MVAGNLSIVPAEDYDRPLHAINNKWEVHYSRFFNFPHLTSSTPSNLKPLLTSRIRSGGTWFSSSSTADLQIITDVMNPETILVVSHQGKNVEEHFTCNLHFTWPQVACATQCPTRGSRVVFASYRDVNEQIQKFALRFATSFDAGTFINALEESLKLDTQTRIPRTDTASEISSQSQFFSSNRQHCRDDDMSYPEPIAICEPHQTPVLNYSNRQRGSFEDSLLGHNLENVSETVLPPSFTELLNNCSAEVLQGLKEPEEEIDLKSEIMKYMTDSSFHDMLAKVEEVISEMGGDLAL